MQLERLELENVCQFGRQEVLWHPGLNGVVGPNGSGKSNIIKAAKYALTGVFDNAGTKEENVYQLGGDQSRSRVTLHLTHGGHRLEIVRNLAGTSARSQVRVNGGRTVVGEKAVTAEVLEALGVDPGVLSRYIFVAQGEMAAFLQDQPAARAEAYSRIFGTAVAERAWAAVGGEIRQATPPPPSELLPITRQSVAEWTTLLADLGRRLAALPPVDPAAVAAHRDTIARHAREAAALVRVAAERGKLDAAAAHYHAVAADLAAREAELAALQRRRQDGNDQVHRAAIALARWEDYVPAARAAAKTAARRAQVAQQLAAAVRPPEAPEFPADDSRRIAELTAQLYHLRRFLANFADGVAACPTCGTPVADLTDAVDAAHRDVATLAAEHDDLAAREQAAAVGTRALAAHEAATARLERELAVLDEAAGPVPTPPELTTAEAGAVLADRGELDRQIVALVARAGDLRSRADGGRRSVATCESALALLAEQLADPVTAAQLAAATAALPLLESAASERAHLAGEHAQAAAALAQQRQTLATLEAREAEHVPLRAWVADLAVVHAALHRDRLPRRVNERNLELVRARVNDNLERFGVDFRVRTGPALSYVAEFPDGRAQPDARLSPGQQAVLALAFRVGLNSLFAGTLSFLSLDEPTWGLDRKNMGCMEVALAKLKELSESRQLQCIVITHEEALEGLFDRILNLST